MKFTRILTVIGWVGLIGVMLFSLFRFGQKLGTGGSGGVAASSEGGTSATLDAAGVQRVTLSFSGFNYSPNVIRVKKDIPVEIVADGKLQGCFSTFVVPELNVFGQFKGAGTKVTFTPKQTGKFRFSCAMGMGRGVLIVEG